MMTPAQLTTSVTAVANAIACKLTEDELGLIAALFTQLGDTLATIAAQRAFCFPKTTEAACQQNSSPDA